MDGYRLLMLCVVVFLSACSSTGTKTSSKSQIQQPTSQDPKQDTQHPKSENQHPFLTFTKEDAGSKALKAAVSQKPTTTSSASMLETEKFVDEKVELVRFSFGTNNPIYVADFKDALMFDHDRATVRGKDKELVNQFAKLYRNGTFGKYIYVIGHTDASGSASYNYALSARRARAVTSILLANKFPASKLNIVPAGEYLPKASNATHGGKQLNRRVEVVSADSRALIQAYLRQLECPTGETCGRKLLNVFDVRKNGRSVELSLSNKQSFASFSPELNNLVKLDNALRSGSRIAEMQLLQNDDKRGLIKIGETRGTFTIPLDIRPVLRIPRDVRKFTIPKNYIVQ